MAGDTRTAPQVDATATPDAEAASDATQATVKSAFSIALGILLGVACAVPTTGEMALRVPALLASLVMVAQGLLDLGRVRQTRLKTEQQEKADREKAAQDQEARARQKAATPTGSTALEGRVMQPGEVQPARDVVAAQHVPPVAVPTPKESMTIPMLVLGLAVWLGLAVIGLEAAPVLRGLALLAAFLLFSHGWSLLPARK
jgi:hypothetical protein